MSVSQASAAEKKAIENARKQLKADQDREFIEQVFGKADAAEEGLAPAAHRARDAAVRLDALAHEARVERLQPLAPREVAEDAAVWVRGLPAAATGAEVAAALAAPGGTVIGCALHRLALWELDEHEARRTDDMPDLRTWGLVAFSSAEEAAAALDHPERFLAGDVELSVCKSDLANHLCYDFDGALWDCWMGLHTVRVQGIPQDLAEKKDLQAYLLQELPSVEVRTVTIVHHYDAGSGGMIGDALITVGPDLSAVAALLSARLRWVGSDDPALAATLQISMTDVVFEVESDLFYEDRRVRRAKERRARKRPPTPPASAMPKAVRESESNPDMFVRHEADEIQMMLAEDSMKIEDWAAAIKSLEKYLKMEPSSQKAAKMMAKAKKKQEEEKTKAREAPKGKPKKVFSTGMWTMARASSKAIGPPRKTKEEIAAGYMKRRRDRAVKAREDFQASKKQDVFALVGALGGGGAAKPGLKMAFGRGKISMSTILNHSKGKESLGKAGHAHLLNMSDGSVLKTGKKSREWDLAHSSVSDTISRARDEIGRMMEKGENTKAYDGLEHPPRRPTEHLSFQLKALEKRGPANTAPRPDNQFGHQCVLPAFTQIEKIKKVTDLCEYITVTEPREQEQAAAAIARAAQNLKKRREANALMKALREQAAQKKLEEERARAEEEAARAAAEETARLEALRRAAESPTTKEARALFEEIDEDDGGTLDRNEIRILAKRLGKKLTDAKLDEAMAQMDADGNGDVDFGEFLSWWKETGSKGFFSGLTFNFLKGKKASETEEERAALMAPEPAEETYFDTFKRERAEAEERLAAKKAEQDAVSRRIMDNAGSLQAVGSLGVAGEDGKFASRMTGAFNDFSLGADVVTGQDRGRSLRVSTRTLLVGPAGKARTMGMGHGGQQEEELVPHPPPARATAGSDPAEVRGPEPAAATMREDFGPEPEPEPLAMAMAV